MGLNNTDANRADGKESNTVSELPRIAMGVHYYRAPTPLPAEWDEDLDRIKEMGFDFVQVRPQWRWHERNEGELQFDDLDVLFDLAHGHGLKVLCKFFLPCAPQWLFEKYDAYRVTPDGHIMRPITLGAMYIGGFAPCFDKDLVREKADPFIRATVARYRGHPALMAWNAWNEPRSRPAADCACKESMAKYREWLQSRFGTVEDFNRQLGLAMSGKGPDFSAMEPPSVYADYTGWLLFRTWRAEMVADRLRWVAEEIRKADDAHPIMIHSGFASVLQDALEDTTSDYLNSRHVDLYGSSCPNRVADMPLLAVQPTAYEAATTDLLCARLRGLGKPFWINEIYGNQAMCLEPTPASYFRQTTYHAIASGAKGIIYWQYRSERLSSESFDAGLTTVSGEPTERSREVARVARLLKDNERSIDNAEVPKATVAIPYDYQSDLMSRIETAAPGMGDFPQGVKEAYPYKSALRGMHLALWELDLQIEVVPAEEYERLLDYRVVYLPCPRMLAPEQMEVLQKFVEKGGLLISEPSPGLRDTNGWINPHVPPRPLDTLMGGREASRTYIQTEKTLVTACGEVVCPPELFVTSLEPAEGGNGGDSTEVIAHWEGGAAAIISHRCGKGRVIYLGAPLGEVYFHTRDAVILAWLRGVLEAEHIEIGGLTNTRQEDVRVRRLLGKDGSEILFLFNYRKEPMSVTVRGRGMERAEELTDLNADIQKANGDFVTQIPATEVLILRMSK